MKSQAFLAMCFVAIAIAVPPSQAAVKVTAEKCITVRADGPRPGENGAKYFNVEGKEHDKYASFGVLVFDIPGEVGDRPIKGLSLTLVQSLPRFAKDGAIRFLLAPDLDPSATLRFDPAASDGVGGQIKSPRVLGEGSFKKIETGKADTFALTLDDESRARIRRGGKLCLVVVPADPTVTATYFGISEAEPDKSPSLTIDLP